MNTVTIRDRSKELARRFLPPVVSRLARRATCHPWYWMQVRDARRGFEEFGDAYPHPTLFVAGLPKSGTTWLKKMVAAYPGYHEVILPGATLYELATGGSHDYDLPPRTFSRLEGCLAVVKTHVHGSERNRSVLAEAGVPYVVLHRDLRDVVVSAFFYVSRTPWHPGFQELAGLKKEDGLILLIRRLVPAYHRWVCGWQRDRDPRMSIEVRYEDLLQDTPREFARIARHFGLDDSSDVIERTVRAHSFERMSGGRASGEEDAGNFFRKGVAGDWAAHFTPSVREAFEENIGSADGETPG